MFTQSKTDQCFSSMALIENSTAQPFVNSTAQPFVNSSTENYEDYYGYTDFDGLGICTYTSHDRYFASVLYSLFFVVGFLGNTLVVWIILCGTHLRSMTDVCLLNLAIADLLLVITLPFLAYYAMHDWVFREAMCTIVLSIYYIGFYGGIFFIVLMSVDRYLAVVHAVFALRVRTKKFGILASMVVWVIAVAAAFPEVLYLRVEEFNGKRFCKAYPLHSNNTNDLRVVGFFKMNVLGLLVPLIIMGFCYWKVLDRLLTLRASKKQAMLLVITVMAVFFFCWTPYNVVAFLKNLELKHIWETDCESSKRLQVAIQVSETIAYFHCCLNPFIYVFVGEKFKKQLIKLLRKTPCIKLQFMTIYLTPPTGSVYSQTTSVDERSIGL